MTANREPRLIKALKRQGGDGLAASCRFFLFYGRFQKPANSANPMSAFDPARTSTRIHLRIQRSIAGE
jgi:hypothetical protein